jgi:broad specificity phosphatase PhoE
MHLYLVRHGQSYVNLPDADRTKPDEALTPLGQKQAKAVGKWLNTNVRAASIFASTMRRTRETAELINAELNIPIQFDARLREIGMNAPDGNPLPTDKLSPYIEDVWGTLKPYDPVTATGENWMQFRARVGSFIESLRDSIDNHTVRAPESTARQTFIVVCHGGVIEAFYEYIFEKGPWSVVSVITYNTGITYFAYQPRENRPDWRLYFHNQVAHLTPDLIS